MILQCYGENIYFNYKPQYMLNTIIHSQRPQYMLNTIVHSQRPQYMLNTIVHSQRPQYMLNTIVHSQRPQYMLNTIIHSQRPQYMLNTIVHSQRRVIKKELSICHKLLFSNSYISATQCRRPQMFLNFEISKVYKIRLQTYKDQNI